MNIYEDFGGWLEEERKRLKLKQAEMAQAAGVSVGAYNNYIRCTSAPDVRALRCWAEVGVDTNYVVFGRPSPEALAPDEEMLVAGWRVLDARARAGVLALMSGLGGPATPAVVGKRSQVIVGGSNNVQIGSVKDMTPRGKNSKK